MSKLLKQLGIGGKKTPPNPPKPDYGIKSTSVQDLLSRSHGDRFGDGTSTISVCEFNRNMTHSHTHSHTESTRSIDRKVRDKGRFSIPRQNRNERHSVNVSDDLRGKLEVVDKDLTMKANQTNQIPIPQPGIADYSDPYDVKKQMPQQQIDELSDVSAIIDIADDDYSIPYNAKKNKSSTLASERQFGDVSARQSFSLGSPNAVTISALTPASSSATSNNSKPSKSPQQETYEEAWKWVTPSQPPSQANGRPTSSSQTAHTPEQQLFIVHGSNSNSSFESVDMNVSSIDGNGALSPANGSSVKTPVANNNGNYVKTPNSAVEGAQTQTIGNNGDLICFEETSVADAIKKALASGMNGSNGPTNIVVSKSAANSQPVAPVSYNEPWDLGNAQEKLMEKLRLASVGGGSVDADGSETSSRSQSTSSPHHTAAALSLSSSSAASSGSTAKAGYDNPMDWKTTSQKKVADDRSKEGYDKPWEWNAPPPSQAQPPKDSRPATEYDQPWDQKVKGIEKDLMKAKGPSVASGGGLAQAVAAAATGDGNSQRVVSLKKANDDRPPEEYDDPWDQKAKKLQDKLTAGDSADTSPMMSGAASPQQSRPSLSSADALSVVTDVNLPLGQQGWYHGAIGRVDAEALLRSSNEGSFLVRQSESNKLDLSLSLKSFRGYMHMKIVTREGKYILGQFSQPFDSVPLMIHHYSLNKLPIKGAEHISLTRPIVNDML